MTASSISPPSSFLPSFLSFSYGRERAQIPGANKGCGTTRLDRKVNVLPRREQQLPPAPECIHHEFYMPAADRVEPVKENTRDCADAISS